MTNTFGLGYKAAWLPRLALAGFGPWTSFAAAPVRHTTVGGRPPVAKRILFLGDLTAVANRRRPEFCESFRNLCRSADLVIANCESPIVERSIMPFQTRLGFCHAMTAALLVDILDAAAIKRDRLVLSLANNHIADQGRAGIVATVEALRAMGIASVGLKSGEAAPWEIVTAGEMQIAILAFTQWIDRDPRVFRDMIRCGLSPDIGDHPPRGVSLALALPHWGCEFCYRPDEEVRRIAARLAALGADVIAGSHPHVVQPLERITGSLVAYSLGDFLGSVLPRAPRHARLSLALAVDFIPGSPRASRIVAYEAHPFFRLPLGGYERIERIDALAHRDRARAEQLAMRILGTAPPESIAPVLGATAPAS